MYKYFLFVLFTLVTGHLSAQQFGNEWINFNQPYYKVKVANEGIYRIDYAALQAAGASVGQIDPRNLQVYYRGKEQYLYVHGESDGSFDNGDYLEFYGEKNDGALDSLLFQNPEDQMHQYFSFYTDSSTYFITWTSSTPGKRFSIYKNTDYSGTKEEYYMREMVQAFRTLYYDGRVPQGYSDYLKLSYYTEGEGWFDNIFGFGAAKIKNIATPNKFTSGPDAIIEIGLKGVSDAPLRDLTPATLNHHIKLAISPGNNTYTVIADDKFKGIRNKIYTSSVPLNSIGTTTNIRYQVVDDINAHTDNNALSYIKITYPAQFNLNGSSKLLYEYSGASNTYTEWQNYASGKSSPVFYDLSSGRKIYGTIISNSIKVVVDPTVQNSRIFLTDSTDAVDLTPIAANFLQYTSTVPSGMDYLIITHPKLSSAASDYENFRSAEYSVYTAFVTEMYDQFMYGQHHPIALRRFVDFLISKGLTPNYVLLLGKGLNQSLIPIGNNINLNLVPTIGEPPSDNLLFAGLGGTVLETPFALGRLAATNNDQVLSYLNKVNENDTIKVADWKKNLLHLSGGRISLNETPIFNQHLNSYAAIAKGPFYGADITHITSNNTIPYPHNSLTEYVIDVFNEGIGLSNYFGHGAADILEIDIGEPSQYSNKGKYPLMYFTGCILGTSYNDQPAMGERFIFEPDKGAIAWIAGTSYGFINYMANFSNVFYKKFVIDEYGKPVGQILRETIKSYQSPGNPYNEMQCLQTTYQGDPAAILYGPAQPDYVLTEENILLPDEVIAEADSFSLGIIAENRGKAVTAQIWISIVRFLPNGLTDTVPSVRINAPFGSDTFFVWIRKVAGATGINDFEITIDSKEEVSEIKEDNNTVRYRHFIASDNATPLFPAQYGIVASTNVDLTAQSFDIFADDVEYEFEIDTIPDFSSPWRKSSGVFTAPGLAIWKVNLLPYDTTAYYWRVRRANNQSEWQISSFSYINNSPEGWGQVHFPQFYESLSTDNIKLDSNSFEFSRTVSPFYYFISSGEKFPNVSQNYLRLDYQRMWFGTGRGGIYVVAVNPDDLSRYYYPSTFNYMDCNLALDWNQPCENRAVDRSGVFNFYWYWGANYYPSMIDSFKQFIKNIPEGYHVMGVSGNKHRFQDMDTSFFETMELIGATKIRNVQNGWPYIYIGKKGAAPGTAIEFTADTNNQLLPPDSQVISHTMQLSPRTTSGNIVSTKIGPAKKWSRFYSNYSGLEDLGNDTVTYTIYGYDSSNNKTALMLIPHGQLDIDISHIDAQHYRYLQLEAHFKDSATRTPAQLDNWIVIYDYLPEASLRPDIHYSFQPDTLPEGDTVRFSVAITNISDAGMDSLLMQYTVAGANRNILLQRQERITLLAARDTIYYSGSFSTTGMVGINTFTLFMNPNNDQPEQHFFNNVLRQTFYVEGDRVNPTLDVTFDGRKLKDGDIVSANPEIVITLRDENSQFLLNDTTVMDVYLYYPDSIRATQLWHSREDMEFVPANGGENKATVIFTPENLKNGTYELVVESRDIRGNRPSSESYSIRFKVVNEASVGYFKVYPNPFSFCTRFEFLLRGSEVPDEILVEIADLSGRVVEVLSFPSQDIHIGLNRPSTCWDGTRQDGSQLPNGMYIYRVNAIKNNKSINFDSSGHSGLFIEDVGKIIIAR